MRRVRVGMQQADRHRLDSLLLETGDERAHRGLVERNEDLARVVHALGDRPAKVPRDERGRPVDGDVVLLETVLEGHLHRVPEPLGDEERGPRAGALDNRVGRERRAVDEEADLAGGDPRLSDRLTNRRDHPFLRGMWGGQHLGGDHGPARARLEGHVREGSADIDGDAATPARVSHDRTNLHLAAPSGRPPVPCRTAPRLRDGTASGLPRVRDFDVQSVEVAHVARRERQIVGPGGPGNQGIADIQNPPERCLLARNRAAHSAPILSKGSMRSSYPVMKLVIATRKPSRRVPSGRSSSPNSSSCTTNAATHRSDCPERNATTRGSGRSLVSSDTTLVSSRNPVTPHHRPVAGVPGTEPPSGTFCQPNHRGFRHAGGCPRASGRAAAAAAAELPPTRAPERPRTDSLCQSVADPPSRRDEGPPTDATSRRPRSILARCLRAFFPVPAELASGPI